MGDFNISYNDSAHRLHPYTSSAHTQDNALTSLLTQGGLQDVCDIPHTWSSTTTWSSPDHITISDNTTFTTHSSYRDTTPWEAHFSDHALLGVTITSFGKVHNSRRRTPFPDSARIKSRNTRRRWPHYWEIPHHPQSHSLKHASPHT